jgi:hypothetical protein
VKLLPPDFYGPSLYGRKKPLRNMPAWAQPERRHYIYRLFVVSGTLPDTALVVGLLGMPRSQSSVWIRERREATRLQDQINRAGGQAHVEQHQAHRCELCKRWLLGILGELLRRQRERERAFDEPMQPCGPGCLEVRASAQKGCTRCIPKYRRLIKNSPM